MLKGKHHRFLSFFFSGKFYLDRKNDQEKKEIKKMVDPQQNYSETWCLDLILSSKDLTEDHF